MNLAATFPFPAGASVASGTQADEEPPGWGEMVTVTQVFNSLEAEILRGCLQAEGIPATLGDAQTIQTDTLLTVALGGIRVMVPATFADAARATVKAFECGALAIDELPADAPAAMLESEPDATAAPGWSIATWIVVAVVVFAVVVF